MECRKAISTFDVDFGSKIQQQVDYFGPVVPWRQVQSCQAVFGVQLIDTMFFFQKKQTHTRRKATGHRSIKAVHVTRFHFQMDCVFVVQVVVVLNSPTSERRLNLANHHVFLGRSCLKMPSLCFLSLAAPRFVVVACQRQWFVVRVTSLDGQHVPSWTYRIYIWICFDFESTSSHLLATVLFYAQYLHKKGNVYFDDSVCENITFNIPTKLLLLSFLLRTFEHIFWTIHVVTATKVLCLLASYCACSTKTKGSGKDRFLGDPDWFSEM